MVNVHVQYRDGRGRDLVSLRPGEVVRVNSVRKHRLSGLEQGMFIYADQAA